MKDHIHVYNIATCWNDKSFFGFLGPTFAIIGLVPLTMPFIHGLMIYHRHKLIMFLLMLYTHVLLFACELLGKYIAQKKPYPECVSFLMSECGMPCPKLVYITAVATISLYYLVRDSGGIHKCFKSFCTIVFSMFTFAFAYYVGYMADGFQITVSVGIGFFTTVIVCFFLESTLFYKIRRTNMNHIRDCIDYIYILVFKKRRS